MRAAESAGTPWLERSVAQATHVSGAAAGANAVENRGGAQMTILVET
jgi:hypothetical protein